MFLWIETRQSVDKNNRWPHSHLLTHLLTHTNHVSMYYRMVRQRVHNFSRYRWDEKFTDLFTDVSSKLSLW